MGSYLVTYEQGNQFVALFIFATDSDNAVAIVSNQLGTNPWKLVSVKKC